MFDWWRKRRERKAAEARNEQDDGADTAGLVIGYATGIPIGPSGITTAALVGSMLHQPASAAPAHDPVNYVPLDTGSSSPTPDTPSSSGGSDYDGSSSDYGGSSSGSSFDSGGGGSSE